MVLQGQKPLKQWVLTVVVQVVVVLLRVVYLSEYQASLPRSVVVTSSIKHLLQEFWSCEYLFDELKWQLVPLPHLISASAHAYCAFVEDLDVVVLCNESLICNPLRVMVFPEYRLHLVC